MHPIQDMRAAMREKKPAKHPDYLSIGEMLHDTRESFRIPLEQVARDLRLKASYLEAIEEGRLDRIPAGIVYAKGYLARYAGYLGINLETMLSLTQVDAPVKPIASVSPARQEPRHVRSAVAVSLALAAFTFVGWMLMEGRNKAQNAADESVRPVPETILAEVKPPRRTPAEGRCLNDADPAAFVACDVAILPGGAVVAQGATPSVLYLGVPFPLLGIQER